MIRSASPYRIDAMAHFDASEVDKPEIDKLFMVDRFGEPFNLGMGILNGSLVVPRGLATVRPHTEDAMADGFQIPIEAYRSGGGFAARFPDQDRVVAESARLLEGGRSHVLLAPTGYGKTYVGSEIALRLGRSFLVVTTKTDIAKQWQDALRAITGRVAPIWSADDLPDPEAPFVIGLVQSLCKRGRYPEEYYRNYGMVIFDEVHKMGAEKFSQACENFSGRLRLGLSATPRRADGRDVVFWAHIGSTEVVAEWDTVPLKVLVLPTCWQLPKSNNASVEPTRGKTTWVDKVMHANRRRNAQLGALCASVERRKRHVLVFSSTLAHLDEVRKAAVEAGVPPGRIGWYVGSGPHAKQQRDIKLGSWKPGVVLTTYSMSNEGTDLPWVDCVMFAHPRADVEQAVGRGRRVYPGKDNLVVFDIWDDGSRVYTGYHRKRMRYYRAQGAEVKTVSVN